MKDYYANYKAEDLWCIKEDGFDPEIQNIRESQFALGNGYLGVRGSLEEKPLGSMPGTYIAGIYDRLTSQVADLVNFPNPFFFKFILSGEKFGAVAMDSVEHHRILNMKDGLLLRRTIYSDVKNKRYDYQSLRFISMDNKNVGVMQITLTPLDDNVQIEVQSGIDTSVFNPGGITEGNKKHFHIKELAHEEYESFRLFETLEKNFNVIYRSGFYYKIGKKKVYATDNILRLKLKKKQTITFTRIFFIASCSPGKNLEKLKETSRKEFRKVFKSNFETLLKKHTQRMHKLWDFSDVVIEGTNDIQKNFRFNIFHMLICAHSDEGFSSIGARTLSGEGYRGHIFWDAEIFMLPFYAYCLPEVARNMLLYRYRRLDQARTIAKDKGYKGAMFPWESAGTGEEETPPWAKDLDGRIVSIKTNRLEHHITADIAYTLMNYVAVTDDHEFMQRYGYEMLFETARFWASRVTKNRQRKYEIKDVIGPDEFHEHVNNNAFTNMMAKWNLLSAYKAYVDLKKFHAKLRRKLSSKLNLSQKEVQHWRYIASLLVFKQKKDRLIEQFDGFFRKRDIKVVSFDENNIPLLPKGIKVKDYNTTQFVKQADVLMLLYLFRDIYSHKTKEINFRYYVSRTLHKSSLSAAMHCLMALEVGALNQAYQFFNVALRADISNLHGNTGEGVHAASLGGVWQCVVNGFAGIHKKGTRLAINPYMPKSWRSIKCSLLWKKCLVKIEASNSEVCLRVEAKQKKKIKIEVFGKDHLLYLNRDYSFRRPKAKFAENYYL